MRVDVCGEARRNVPVGSVSLDCIDPLERVAHFSAYNADKKSAVAAERSAINPESKLWSYALHFPKALECSASPEAAGYGGIS